MRVAAVAAAAGMLATGCSKVSNGENAGGGRHGWTQAGVLRIGENQDTTSLVPELASSALVGDLSMFIFSYAVRYDANAKPVPDALSEIPTVENGDVSKDGLTLKYKLRPNMKWQDGQPLTCADLKFVNQWDT